MGYRQLFPIVPLHRLTDPQTDFATLVDVTCDSDGKIDQFVDLRDVRETLELPEWRDGEEYYLGIFLVGAYQEVMDRITISLAFPMKHSLKSTSPGSTFDKRYVEARFKT